MVGEIHDEFDVVERPLNLPDGGMIFDAAIKIRELEARYNIVVPEDPSYETIGGFVLNRLGFIPRGDESFEADGFRFTVMEMDHRRVSRVKMKPLRPAAEGDAAPVEQANEKKGSSPGTVVEKLATRKSIAANDVMGEAPGHPAKAPR
jgi:putative hemolysin